MAKRHASGSHGEKKGRSAAIKTKQKTVKLKPHHAKAYRKRLVGALVIFLLVGTALATWLVMYRNQITKSVQSAQDFISDTFTKPTESNATVSSTLGFSFTYDIRNFTASAVDAATGDLYIGRELETNRPYQTVRLSTGLRDLSQKTERNLTINYYDTITATSLKDQKLIDQERKVALTDIDLKTADISVVSTDTTSFDGVAFTQTEWKLQPKQQSAIATKLDIGFRTYAGVVDGKVVVIKVAYGISSGSAREVFAPVLKSLEFGTRTQSRLTPSQKVAEKVSASQSLLNTLLFTRIASAEASAASSSEKISARYSPAVVKIYNFYCMDIKLDSTQIISNICDGGLGSGFFIDGNGNIATNGHVASVDPLDITIQTAIDAFISTGNPGPVNSLLNVADVKQSDLDAHSSTDEEYFDYLIDRLYGIDSSRITATNNTTNLMVGLNEKEPDLTEYVKVTKNRQEYAEQDSIKRATLVAKDYRSLDGIKAYHASDVAIIKIEGSNYPVTKLGSLNGLSQGAGLMILGYPGEASDNGLVEDTASKPTLTAGKVSSVKNAKGSDKKLIETDTTIGHGNSGGPALNESGEVVGIATYTSDGSGQGNGVYNYVRDIQDLKDLAGKKSATVNTVSETQKEWDKALDAFYTAHYSKSLKSFEKVKKLYPQHPRVDELVATANERIKNGQDVKDFPILFVIIGVVALVGAAVTAFLIIRHRTAHKVYVGQVAAGAMPPLAPGAQPQVVSYNPAAVRAQPMPTPTFAPTTPGFGTPTPPVPPAPLAGTIPSAGPQVVTPSAGNDPSSPQPPRVI